MKRKAFPILLCFLICLSLVGVGFAGWVITAPDTKSAEGQIVVEEVTENNYAIEPLDSPWSYGKSSFNFVGPTTSSSKEGDWLTYDGAQAENLTVTYQFKVKRGTTYLTENNGVVTAKAVLGEKVNTAITNTYIKLVDGIDVNSLTVSVSGDVFSVTLTFAWGDKFGGNNPYNYYNAQTYSSTIKEDAITSLGALKELTGEKITITITAK